MILSIGLLCTACSQQRVFRAVPKIFGYLGMDSAKAIHEAEADWRATIDSVTHLGPYTFVHFAADPFGFNRNGLLRLTIVGGVDSVVEWRLDHGSEEQPRWEQFERTTLDSLAANLGTPEMQRALFIYTYTWVSGERAFRYINVRKNSMLLRAGLTNSRIMDTIPYPAGNKELQLDNTY